MRTELATTLLRKPKYNTAPVSLQFCECVVVCRQRLILSRASLKKLCASREKA